MNKARRRQQILTQPEPARVPRTSDAIVLKEGALFLLSTASGDVPWTTPHGFGLFFRDCRYLDGFELTIDRAAPVVLSADDARGFETHHYLTNPELRPSRRAPVIPKFTLALNRHRVIKNGVLHELIRVRNFGRRRAGARLRFRVRSRFEDIFVVRGFVRGPRGVVKPPAVHAGAVALSYQGRDSLVRTTEILFSPLPTELNGDRAVFALTLDPGATQEITIRITPCEGKEPRPARALAGPDGERPAITRWLERSEEIWLSAATTARSANPLFDRILRRAVLDLRLLRSLLDGAHYFAAGIPWFATLFGRDALIVALQTLSYGRELARQTLELLARYQATATDAYRDAEPGKILHELRVGELARLGEIPQSLAYYGSVDATMLFLVLAARYVAWSGDLEVVGRLRPHLDRALDWTLDAADHDGDGYVDYTGGFETGLVNQGWKDTGTAIVNADGSLAEPPIALAEVQAYTYRAWREVGGLLRLLGEHERAADLDRRAEDLRQRFERDFWDDELGCYVLALQKGRRPAAVVSSNAGQVLWGGIASPERAARIAERLMAPDMFSGWGIRTLAATSRCYNPMGYHLGAVWPHDNALVIAGLRRYGHDEAALRVFDALVDAASRFRDYRLPELYCGYDRAQCEDRPVGYPVACSPQAWAAGALPHALWNLLGLHADAPERRLDVVRPRLPSWVEWLEIDGVTVGGSTVALRFTRQGGARVGVEATVRDGELRVVKASD